jgi:vancomycin resistance protein YoaR
MPERQTSPGEVSPDTVDADAEHADAVQADAVEPSATGSNGARPAPAPAEPVAPNGSPTGSPADGPAPADPRQEGPTAPDRRPDGESRDVAGDDTPAGTPEEARAAGLPAAAGTDAAEGATVILPPLVESTDEVPAAARDAEAPTEVIPRTAKPRRRRRVLVLAGAVVVLLAALYVVDLLLSAGTVPRGVTVAGQDIGGLSRADAERRVRAAVEPRTTRPVAVAAGDVTSAVDPRAAGLAVDWTATIDQAGSQPLNPITRVRSLFTHREVGVVSRADDDALDSALQQLTSVVNRAPAEGTVRFDGVTPVPVPPVDGQELDVAAAHQVLERDWTNGTVVRLPVRVLKPTTTADQVTQAVTAVATPAVSGPVTVVGEKVTGTITPEVIAKALSFRPDTTHGLAPELNKDVIHDALDPQLASSEQPGRDATISFATGKPVVTPSQDGRGIDYDATLKDLLTVLTRTGDERRVTAVYAPQPAKLTTEQLNGFGIVEVIGQFTTGGFAVDSGQNIRRAAQIINGMIVKPGGTFSLNGATEPRDAAHGYVEAGIISDGHASRGIGGGVSQLATTLYNAAYFAGMTDVTHKPHSFYISRYPPGREATVFEGAIDLKFRNDSPTGVLIQTVWTPSSLTVRLYGTKHYDVTSTTGPRTNPTEPTNIELPAGPDCKPSLGAPGFTVTDTRTLHDVKTGQVRTERRTTKYNPSPIVTCSGG